LDDKYKDVEKATKELVAQQIEIGGKSTNKQRDSNHLLRDGSRNDEENANIDKNEYENSGKSRKQINEEAKALDIQNHNYRAAIKFGSGGGKWGKSSSGSSNSGCH